MTDEVSLEELPEEVRQIVKAANQSLDSIVPEIAIENFLDHKRGEIRQRTVDEYRDKLAYFEQFCQERHLDNLNDLDGRTVDAYRRWRRVESTDEVDQLAPKTMRDEMYLFRDFLRYLSDIDGVGQSLPEKVRVPSLGHGDGVRDIDLSPTRLENTLEYLDEFHYATRPHVVWTYHRHVGRRPGGLVGLDLEDLHLDSDEPYIELRHREETPLKNGVKSEAEIALSPEVAQVFRDYIENNRIEATTEAEREPFLTSRSGRLSQSSMRRYVYAFSRPCAIGEECPHDTNVEDCEAAESYNNASKCPSSRPPYALRHGYISAKRNQGIPKAVISDRCDVSEDVLDKHYDERSASERRQLRQKILSRAEDGGQGGGYQ